MNVLLIHTLVLALASHRIAAHEQSDSDTRTASDQGDAFVGRMRDREQLWKSIGLCRRRAPSRWCHRGCELGGKPAA